MSVPSLKIIDGTEAPVNAFPWIASIQYEGNHFCGGSLLTEDIVITAAHCMDFGNLKNFIDQLVVSARKL
jgi:secreted trypsin-like serine protease